jgi:hypothetical protein
MTVGTVTCEHGELNLLVYKLGCSCWLSALHHWPKPLFIYYASGAAPQTPPCTHTLHPQPVWLLRSGISPSCALGGSSRTGGAAVPLT